MSQQFSFDSNDSQSVPATPCNMNATYSQYAFAPKSQSSETVHSCVAGLASGLASTTSATMIKEISQRIYSVAVVSLWVVVVAGTSAVILASTVNGGISW
jgi:hypothetical protein